MRALCSLGGPLPASARLLALRMPGSTQPIHFLVESKSRVRDVRAQVYAHFREQGHTDLELFGLALFHNNEYLFLDTDSKLSKYAPKSWRASHTHGLGANGRPLLELHLAVQFYVESPILLGESLCKHLYYLQLRSNLILRDILPMEIVLLLAGLALQADFGNARDYDDKDYFNPKDFTPPTLSGDWVSSAIRACHKDYHGMSKSDAETRFIREACVLSDPINSHLYRMKASKTEPEPGSVCISVSARGIKISAENGLNANFVWSSIVKLCFDRKKFEIKTEDDKVTLYASDDEKCKFLLSLCKDTHQFSMKIAPILSEIYKKEEDERKHCFGYNKLLNLANSKNKKDQRVSVISTTSSNTTSGIVSDRVQSEDELEIMIDTPPAPSLESLAFAHLLDDITTKSIKRNFHFDSVGNVDSFPNTSQNSAQENVQKEQSCITNIDNSIFKKSDCSDSSHVKCTGSQCSSSCSTVIMSRAGFSKNRRFSNGSSLELSFSHTAQNSVISNTSTFVDLRLNRPEDTTSALYDGLGQPATLAASSETSGVYTMESSDTIQHNKITESISDGCTTEDGSYHYAEYNLHQNNLRCSNPTKQFSHPYNVDCEPSSTDCIDGIVKYPYEMNSFRLRSNSNTSLRSFHGDGSDPTDKKHNILSALELSDLIVGRGDYPMRLSVSDTLDSVSDYVRLPLSMNGDSYLQGHEDTAPSEDSYLDVIESFSNRPPTPPKRIDSRKCYSSTPNLLDLSDTLNLSAVPLKPPPPYDYNHVTIPVKVSSPPFSSTQTSNTTPKRVKQSLYDIEEASARVITSKPMINILKAEIGQVGSSSERIFAGPVSAAAPPPPPRSTHHLPPPPPPRVPHLHQLYSDVDFVVFPHQDPSISRQNYLDSKIAASINSTLKVNGTYGSSTFLPSSALSDRSFGSTQNLSDSYVRLAGGFTNMYVSTPDFHARFNKSSISQINSNITPPLPFPRTKSDDNILNSIQTSQNLKPRRIPPPPPPYEHKKHLPNHLKSAHKIHKSANMISRKPNELSNQNVNVVEAAASSESKPSSLDIKSIREKSMNLDLPLISALCNDKSLLKQTKLSPKPNQTQPVLSSKDVKKTKRQPGKSLLTEIKTPEDKLKIAESHGKSNSLGKKFIMRNPNDKLPELPSEVLHTPRAKSNTYVSHPVGKLKKAPSLSP